jgi:hypothetical protein
MKSRKPFLLRISPELYDALEAWAQQELRSVNGQIEYLLKEAVQKRDRKFAEHTEAAPDAGSHSIRNR